MEWSQANLDSVEKGGHSLAGKQLAILNLQPANGALDQVLQCVFRPQACVCVQGQRRGAKIDPGFWYGEQARHGWTGHWVVVLR